MWRAIMRNPQPIKGICELCGRVGGRRRKDQYVTICDSCYPAWDRYLGTYYEPEVESVPMDHISMRLCDGWAMMNAPYIELEDDYLSVRPANEPVMSVTGMYKQY
jgi:hypothetical protein